MVYLWCHSEDAYNTPFVNKNRYKDTQLLALGKKKEKILLFCSRYFVIL